MQTLQTTADEPHEGSRPSRGVSHTTALDVGPVAAGTAFVLVAVLAFQKGLVTGWVASWRVGAFCLATGAGLLAWGLVSMRRRGRSTAPLSQSPAVVIRRDPTMPMLGALLVYKYRAITEGQLQRAMEFQRKQKRRGRELLLGQVLSQEMGLVSSSQLREALEFQQSRVRQGYWSPSLDSGETDVSTR
jgi:hypothetical protein